MHDIIILFSVMEQYLQPLNFMLSLSWFWCCKFSFLFFKFNEMQYFLFKTDLGGRDGFGKKTKTFQVCKLSFQQRELKL